jgi:hypothetical protein
MVSKSFKDYCYGKITNISETWGWFVYLDEYSHNIHNNKNKTISLFLYNKKFKKPIAKLKSRESLSKDLNKLEENYLETIFENEKDYEDDFRNNNFICTNIIRGMFFIFLSLYIIHFVS